MVSLEDINHASAPAPIRAPHLESDRQSTLHHFPAMSSSQSAAGNRHYDVGTTTYCRLFGPMPPRYVLTRPGRSRRDVCGKDRNVDERRHRPPPAHRRRADVLFLDRVARLRRHVVPGLTALHAATSRASAAGAGRAPDPVALRQLLSLTYGRGTRPTIDAS